MRVGSICLMFMCSCGVHDHTSPPPTEDTMPVIVLCFEAADCDDGNPCLAHRCLQGVCATPPSNEGLPCDGGVCRDGGCEP